MKRISPYEYLEIVSKVAANPSFHTDNWRATSSGIEIYFDGFDIDGIIDIPRNKSVHFVNCKLKHVKLDDGKIDSLVFENTKVIDIEISSSQLVNLQFNRTSQIDNVTIADSISIGNITIHAKTVLGSLEISGNSTIGTIHVDHSTINDFRFYESACTGLYFNKSSVNQNIELTQSADIKSFMFQDSFLKRELNIVSSQLGNFSLTGSQIGDINVLGSSLNSFIITSSKNGWIGLRDSTITSIKLITSSATGINVTYLRKDSKRMIIEKSLIAALIITLENSFEMMINDSTIWSLSFSKKIFPKDAILRLSDCKCNQMIFSSFTNQGAIYFNNITALEEGDNYKTNDNLVQIDAEGKYIFETTKRDSEIKILNSDLGKTSFIGCNLNNFSRFVFLNSRLLDVFIADTLLPKKERILTTENKISGYEKLEQTRLALSQFKKIYENRGDVVMAIEYHAQEMETYRQCLKFAKPKSRTERWDIRGERVNLWLNRTSSYYGNNWLKAIIITLGLNWFLFTLYCLFLGYRPGTDYQKFGELFSYSWEFLNPIRKINVMSENVTSVSRIIDYLSRIVIAYCVYQTIQAFRKFGKKSV